MSACPLLLLGDICRLVVTQLEPSCLSLTVEERASASDDSHISQLNQTCVVSFIHGDFAARGTTRSRDWLEGKRRQGPALISFKSIHSRSDNLGRPIRLVLGLEFQFYWTQWSADTCFFRDTPRSIHSLKLVPNERSLNSACEGGKNCGG